MLPSSVVSKKSSDLCSIHSTWSLCPSFYEGLDVFVEPGDLLASIDLKNSFHDLQLRLYEFEFLCFQWRDTFFQWCVLPFGVKSAPYLYSRTVREVVHFFSCAKATSIVSSVCL